MPRYANRSIEIEQAEYSLEGNKKLMKQRDQVLYLSGIPEFKSIINELYLVEEAASFVSLAGDPALNAEQRNDALQMALAPGHLKRWLSVQIAMGNTAEDNIRQLEHTLDVLRATSDEDYLNDNFSTDVPDQNTP